jgi:hypothetical protein
MVGMHSSSPLQQRASELVEAARTFQAAAEQPGGHPATPALLADLEEALQVLSAAWYQLATDASTGIAKRRGRESQGSSWKEVHGLTREQEVHLVGTLHDIAAAFASCARTCREGRSTLTPIIARRVAGQADNQSRGDNHSWPESREPPIQYVA